MWKYEVWCPDLGGGPENARSFDASDSAQAAEKWADWKDGYSADYRIVGGENVTGRTERAYSARPACER